jgi:hypothetical protein
MKYKFRVPSLNEAIQVLRVPLLAYGHEKSKRLFRNAPTNVTFHDTIQICWNIRGCIQKFPDWVDNEISAYNNKHWLRSNTKGYVDKSH